MGTKHSKRKVDPPKVITNHQPPRLRIFTNGSVDAKIFSINQSSYVSPYQKQTTLQKRLAPAGKTADFAIALMKENNTERSIVFSPLSLGTALCLVELGANGETKEELNQVLIKDLNQSASDHYSDLMNLLATIDESLLTVNVANKIVLSNNFKIESEYKQQVQAKFKTRVESKDFGKASEVAQSINLYIEQITRGKITDIITDKAITSSTRAILVNAVYFKGAWGYPFKEENTKEEDFHGITGKRKEMFMCDMFSDNYAHFSDSEVSCLGVMYREYLFTHMWFFLPNEGISLKDWIDGMNGEKLVKILESVSRNTECHVKLPKFKIETTLLATEQIKSIGVKKLFSPEADLSGISKEGPLWIDEVLHKAFIEINEEGTEAAAVTCLNLRGCGSCGEPPKPKEFYATRPFFYCIAYDKHLLFCGTYY